MKFKFYYIVIVLLLSVSCKSSCKKATLEPKNNNQKYTISELTVVDTVFQKQIEKIFFTSDCFKNYQQEESRVVLSNKKSSIERNVVRILNSHFQNEPDLFLLGFYYYCGQKGDDLKNISGGFYITYNHNHYLFIIDKEANIPPNTYIHTDKAIDVSNYLISNQIINGKDFNLYIKNSNNHLSLVGVNCDGE